MIEENLLVKDELTGEKSPSKQCRLFGMINGFSMDDLERERENRNELVFDLTQSEYVDDNVDKWFSSDRILSIVYRIELISKDLFRVHIRMYLHRQVSMSFDFPNYNRAEEYLPKESTIHSAFPNANQCNRSHRHRDVDFVLEQSAMAKHRT